MSDIKSDREAYIQGIQSLLENLSEAETKQLYFQLCDTVYVNSEITIDELIEACNRKSDDWAFEHRKIVKKAFVEYKTRVQMAMYYVSMFQVRRWKDEYHQYSPRSWREQMNSNWWPFPGEVSEKLHLSEEEIICIARLYLNYFLAKAEHDTGLDVEELKQSEWKCPSSDYEAVRKESCFKLFQVKDLAKLYMLQRFYARMNQARVFRDDECDIKNQLWRNILATEDMSEKKVDKMKNCPREKFAGSDIEVKFSLHLGDYIDKSQEVDVNVLKAYELLNQGKNYDEVMGATGLSFKEVRVLDCFTIVKAKEEARD